MIGRDGYGFPDPEPDAEPLRSWAEPPAGSLVRREDVDRLVNVSIEALDAIALLGVQWVGAACRTVGRLFRR